MSTTRLKLYNDALIICGERSLASLTENREPRHLLDHVWDNDGVHACLEAGQWRFAMRSVMVDYDATVSPSFGYSRAFSKPTDWCCTSALCSDEFFNAPLLQYSDEAGFWYCHLDTIYVRYVSDDSAFGGDLSTWTTKFTDFAAAHFASKIIFKLTSDKDKRNDVLAWMNKKLSEAKNLDAMSDPTRFPPPGSWASARRGWGRRDRGSRGSLIG
jgi:hypothetical protein